jgi:hypothetical protein
MISDLEGLWHGCRDANKTLAGLRKECADLKVLALKASLTYVFFSIDSNLVSVFRIPRIHMFLGLPDLDPLVRGMDPDPSIIKQK